ncbi:MAG: (d)CMP kinase [Bacteroidota bacterium]
MEKIIVAIDGYSACGKSSTAKVVAKELDYGYIDTGAMYRAVTLYFHENYLNCHNPKELAKGLENINIEFKYDPESGQNVTYLNGLNVEEEIRKMYISKKVSEVSAIPEVRRAMVTQQQKMGKKKGIVMDGRDIGTVVFPGAELKIFMTADFQKRAERRQKELLEKGELVDLEEIMENLRKRDLLDTSRKESPLRKADEAFEIDTTHVTLQEQVDKILNLTTTKLVETEKSRQKSI